jgi:hypothetical protein
MTNSRLLGEAALDVRTPLSTQDCAHVCGVYARRSPSLLLEERGDRWDIFGEYASQISSSLTSCSEQLRALEYSLHLVCLGVCPAICKPSMCTCLCRLQHAANEPPMTVMISGESGCYHGGWMVAFWLPLPHTTAISHRSVLSLERKMMEERKDGERHLRFPGPQVHTATLPDCPGLAVVIFSP